MRRGMTQHAAAALGLLMAISLSFANEATAQTKSAVNLQREFEQAFQQMLNDPSNLDISFKYAELGIQIGDYEAAISALERMLLFNPDLPRVRLELGVLYYRLGSYSIARSYLTRAVEGENVPDDVRARVAIFLDEIDNRLSNHRISGSVFTGLRYQSNANAGPERPAIRLLDGEGELDNEFTRKADFNAFLSTNFTHVYDPQTQSGEVLESNLLIYGSQQFNQHQLDLVFTELTIGPRTRLLREYMENASWRPHAIGAVVNLDDSPYYYSFGMGLDADKQFTDRTNASLSTSIVRNQYRANSDRSTARLQTGTEIDFSVDVNHRANEILTLTTNAGITNLDTRDSLHGNTEYSFGVGAVATYDPPEGVDTGPWTSSLTGEVFYSRYHAPDSSVDSFKKRKDTELRGTFFTTVPVTRDWSLTSTVVRTVVDSRFINYTYTNWAVSIGGSYRF